LLCESAPRDLGSIQGDGHPLDHFPVDLGLLCRGFGDHGGCARDKRLNTPNAHKVRSVWICGKGAVDLDILRR
jgi:hypothetical protein